MENELGFTEALKIGKSGEQTFVDIMKERGYDVEDVSNDPEYQSKDIDFVYRASNGKEQTFEVKSDTRIGDTRNLFIEFAIVFENDNSSIPGFLDKSKADILAYNDLKNKIFYIFDYNKLKTYVHTHQDMLRVRTRKDSMRRSDSQKNVKTYYAYGFLVNVDNIGTDILKGKICY